MGKLAIVLLIIISLSLQFKLWFKEDGISGILKINRKIKQQDTELNELKIRNNQLLDNIKQIKQNPDSLEEHARVVFGMVKNNETYYRIIE